MTGINFLDTGAFLLLEALLRKKYYLRELAGETGLAPSSVHKIIAQLLKRKMVLTESQKNRKLFSLNYNSPLTTKTLSLIFVNKITSCKAFAKLKGLKPKGVYLFGTASIGQITSDSDIDLAVFFENKPDALELSEVKRELSNELKREVQLITLTKEKVKNMEIEKLELLNQIKNKSTVLCGEAVE